MYRKNMRIHLVGIGGSGMSGIAEVLLNLGYRVSGSDLAPGPVTARLEQLGARIARGHSADTVAELEPQVVVVSSAVRGDNPEVVSARERGIPVIPRAEMLAELMRMKHGVAIAGSHGKTTTTSLTAAVLQAGELDPTVVIGGRLMGRESGARLGEGSFLVAEADESDGSFLHLAPTIAVVTNIDPEHLEHYGDFASLMKAFGDFVNKVPFHGLAVLNVDHPNVQALLPIVEKRFVTYGMSPQADVSATHVEHGPGGSTFTVVLRGEARGQVRLPMPGAHNVSNALAVVAVADELEVPFERVVDALEGFEGIERRFQQLGEVGGVRVVDDYGHHPAEVRATLEAARGERAGRVVVAFQPHRYTRTRDLAEDFHGAFHQADLLFVTPIYAAGEPAIEGVDSEGLVEGVRRHGHRDAHLVADLDELVDRLATSVRPGDLVITLGAGSIGTVGPKLLERLDEEADRR